MTCSSLLLQLLTRENNTYSVCVVICEQGASQPPFFTSSTRNCAVALCSHFSFLAQLTQSVSMQTSDVCSHSGITKSGSVLAFLFGLCARNCEQFFHYVFVASDRLNVFSNSGLKKNLVLPQVIRY